MIGHFQLSNNLTKVGKFLYSLSDIIIVLSLYESDGVFMLSVMFVETNFGDRNNKFDGVFLLYFAHSAHYNTIMYF